MKGSLGSVETQMEGLAKKTQTDEIYRVCSQNDICCMLCDVVLG